MDLSKVSDTLNCNLLVAERNTCGLHLNTASFIKSYLRNNYILGPPLFNIFIHDIFLYIENSDLCNYADDSTLYESLSIIIENLRANF